MRRGPAPGRRLFAFSGSLEAICAPALDPTRAAQVEHVKVGSGARLWWSVFVFRADCFTSGLEDSNSGQAYEAIPPAAEI